MPSTPSSLRRVVGASKAFSVVSFTPRRLIAETISETVPPQGLTTDRIVIQPVVVRVNSILKAHGSAPYKLNRQACQSTSQRVWTIFCFLLPTSLLIKVICITPELRLEHCRYVHSIQLLRFCLTIVGHKLHEPCPLEQCCSTLLSTKDLK